MTTTTISTLLTLLAWALLSTFSTSFIVPQVMRGTHKRIFVENSGRISRSLSLPAKDLDSSQQTKQIVGKESGNQSLKQLEIEQRDFTIGYLNKHHSDLLLKFIEVFSPFGAEMAKANVWSGESYVLQNATLFDISLEEMKLRVTVKRRGKPTSIETVTISTDADPVPEKQRAHRGRPHILQNDSERLALDDLVRRLCRLCWIAGKSEVTGKLIQLAIQVGGSKVGELPENMYLNQVPHNRYVRKYFYDKAAQAVHDAVILCSNRKISNRMKLVSVFPEMNPSMDSYRIGTLLEMIRTIAIKLAEENLRVRICVQGSMGVGIFTGTPKQLSGVAKLFRMMDWQSDKGEENEGMIGNYISFGAVGEQHVINSKIDENGNVVQHQDDVFLIVAPQSMVGTDCSIIPSLSSMVDAAGDRPVILINPDLTDKVSAAGQQSVRGRQQRIDFANSFDTVYHFQNIYISGTSYFPILGAVTKLHPIDPWVAHQRRDFTDGGEIYVPILADEEMPTGEFIMKSLER